MSRSLEKEVLNGIHTYMDRVDQQLIATVETFDKLKQNPFIYIYTNYDTDQPRGKEPKKILSDSSGSTTDNDSTQRDSRGNEEVESVVQEVRKLQEPAKRP